MTGLKDWASFDIEAGGDDTGGASANQLVADASGMLWRIDPGSGPATPVLDENGQQIRFTDPAAEFNQQAEKIAIEADRLAQQIAAGAQQHAEFTDNLEFLRDKLAVEEAANLRNDAIQTAQLIEQRAARIDRHNQEMAALTQRAQELQAQLNQSAAETNAQLGLSAATSNADRAFRAATDRLSRVMEAARISEQARQFNIEQQRQVARDLASFVREPGDSAAFGAFLAANGQPGGIGTALAKGQGFITDTSLMPIEAGLTMLDQLRQPNERLNALLAEGTQAVETPQVTAPQVTAGQVPTPSFVPFARGATGSMLNAALNAPAPSPADASLPGSRAPAVAPASAAPAAPPVAAPDVGKGRPPATLNDVMNDPFWSGFTGDPRGTPEFAAIGLEGGGAARGLAIVGESSDGKPNPELVIGDFAVVPLDKLSRAENGGFFGKVTKRTKRSQKFLNDAVRFALNRERLNQIVPPVGVAAPGTPDFLVRSRANLASSAAGVPPGSYLNAVMRLRGLVPGVAQRQPVITRAA